jgi:hypothetical protein
MSADYTEYFLRTFLHSQGRVVDTSAGEGRIETALKSSQVIDKLKNTSYIVGMQAGKISINYNKFMITIITGAES